MAKRLIITVEKSVATTEAFEISEGEDIDSFIEEVVEDMTASLYNHEDGYNYSIDYNYYIEED